MPDTLSPKRRYIPLIEASKISGYTGEYIERLCRIGKIPCRHMGEKLIVELDALLTETGTILVSGEHVGFIEISDQDERYPHVAFQDVKTSPTHEPEETVERSGHIAVIGETVHSEDDRGQVSSPSKEKFPSNALPLFSQGGTAQKHGIHIPVSVGSMNTEPSTHVHKSLIVEELRTSNDGSTHSYPLGNLKQEPSGGLGVKTMQSDLRKLSSRETQNTVVTQELSQPLQPSLPTLPMIPPERGLSSIGVFLLAFSLLIAPTLLGGGRAALDLGIEVGKAFESSSHALLAAVGVLPAPVNPKIVFPHLTEMSELLSAVSVSEGQHNQQGVILTSPAGGITNEEMRAQIEGAFSDPVRIVPDGTNGKTGIIKPMFQDGGGKSYLYLMVPITQ